jgi:hypothetical protein
MGKSQRDKGAAFERRRARWWQRLGWSDARRNLSQYQKRDGKDIVNTEPYVEQCKVGKKINILSAYKEAKESASSQEVPLAAIHYDDEDTLIVLSEKDFEWLLLCGEVKKEEKE